MVRPDIQDTFQCAPFKSIAHIVLEPAVGSKIILSDGYCRFTELQIFRSECEQGFFYFYIRHLFHFQLHITEGNGSRSGETIVLFLFDV